MNGKPMAVKDDPVDEIDEEEGVEVELEASEDEEEVNPNVAAQLKESSSEEGISDDDTTTTLSIKDRYYKFLEENPEAKDIHGKATEKRIKKMTFEAKEAQRQRDEAIEHAQRVQRENNELRTKQSTQDGAFLTEHMSRLQTQLTDAKRRHNEAYNLNDPEGIAQASEDIAVFANQLKDVERAQTQYKTRQEEEVDKPTQTYMPTPNPAVSSQPNVDPKAKDWAEENEWFGEDKELTESALAIHRKLVTQDGYLPSTNAYYAELNARMAKNFPDHEAFKKTEVNTTNAAAPTMKTVNSPVAPVTNGDKNPGGGGRRVKLTAAQVAVAKRLGLTLEQYAEHVPKV